MSTPFWGKYRGVVSDNADPLRIGRIRATVPDVYGGDESGWAMPAAPFGGAGSGFFAIPPTGAGVWLEFEHGDPDYPVWSGCWWGSAADMPPKLLLSPTDQVMVVTPGGNTLTLSDVPGVGGVILETADGAKISMTSVGIEIDNGQGASIKLTGPMVSVNSGALDVM
ncbi:MAG: phage baseplate assembly protein V [Intrasporangium sp.]|uniref:phage baseplate assembly protein V n=1 Tax=Intrasporangium sp. TaxID=1925024 RepID=UPI00264957C9|nr:phage baseplate assembly protein V [Intrasporangium sp.]MDN5794390.1 phage baseplate assembly protein V [Intrasporangium sp.]